VFCQIFNRDVFMLVCLWKLIMLFPPAKQDFKNFSPLKVFASKAATRTVIVGQSNNDLKIFINRNFRAAVSSFPALHKLINAFPVFPRNSGRGPHKWISLEPRTS